MTRQEFIATTAAQMYAAYLAARYDLPSSDQVIALAVGLANHLEAAGVAPWKDPTP